MTRGSTPTAAAVTRRASGGAPAFSPAVLDPTINAAAPSLMPEALPAVTMPFSTIGLSFASVSRVMPGRGCSSSVTSVVSPRWGPAILTGWSSPA